MPTIRKVLVANRGEIAIRVMRTCKERGISTVAVYSDADRSAPHVLMADEAVHIGPAPSAQSYLVMDAILQAANDTGADAIHPGYGFLSENAEFAARCERRGIIFIGPSPEAIRTMGDKMAARQLMHEAKVPYPPGTTEPLSDVTKAKQIAREIGFPVLVKAAAGGGGKGMRIVASEEEFEAAIRGARSEAKNAFGDDRVYIEKYLEEPRHVEFQIMADTHGNVLHLFDRECSIQRRHQKVIEEAPCPILSDDLRSRMAQAAVKAAQSCNYVGAGTIEFLVDRHRNFYFLEMNTRLQVEHPVTEWITGLDLVALQIQVAEGKALPITQQDVRMEGHSIECRIYAEDPQDRFLPSTGLLHRHRIPSGPGVRVDAGVTEGQQIPIHYDPMISKLSVHASTREAAIERMLRALGEYQISGCKTTIPFCSYVLRHPAFRSARYDTHFIKEHYLPELLDGAMVDSDHAIAAIAAVMLRQTAASTDQASASQTVGAIHTVIEPPVSEAAQLGLEVHHSGASSTSVSFASSHPYAPSPWWTRRRG